MSRLADDFARRRHPTPTRAPPDRRQASGPGEMMALWAMWAILLAAMVVTYARLDPSVLYHVSRDGWAGGVSRALVWTNFPIALFAIAPILISLDLLGPRHRWVGAAAITACAVTAWPGVVDQGDLDGRAINVVAALGVAVSFGLTISAARRSGLAFAPRRPLDGLRATGIAVTAFLSLPWIFAAFGFHIPEIGFIGERPITGADGTVSPAVHLGGHHGFDGALLLISALMLSRVWPRSPRLGGATRAYLALMAAYGGVNFVQDLLNEQVTKRGWIDWTIPNASQPAVTPVWLAIVILAGTGFWVLGRESRAGHRFDRERG